MARYVTAITSQLAPEESFAYLADFANARFWDPSVSEARREGDSPIGLGSEFSLVARFGGRDVPLLYRIVAYEPPRLVTLEADHPRFVSRDTITVTAATGGSTVDYDALLAFKGLGRLLDPLMQRMFDRVGAKATAGLNNALNP